MPFVGLLRSLYPRDKCHRLLCNTKSNQHWTFNHRKALIFQIGILFCFHSIASDLRGKYLTSAVDQSVVSFHQVFYQWLDRYQSPNILITYFCIKRWRLARITFISWFSDFFSYLEYASCLECISKHVLKASGLNPSVSSSTKGGMKTSIRMFRKPMKVGENKKKKKKEKP